MSTRQQSKHAIKVLAEQLLAESNLHDWAIQDLTRRNLKGRAYTPWLEGLCDYDSKIIFLKLSRLVDHPVEYRRAVILHEIAHAISTSCGHDLEWAECMMRLGQPVENILYDLSRVMCRTDAARVEDAAQAQIAFDAYAGGIDKLALFLTALRNGEDKPHATLNIPNEIAAKSQIPS
jgi:hypothetical protein